MSSTSTISLPLAAASPTSPASAADHAAEQRRLRAATVGAGAGTSPRRLAAVKEVEGAGPYAGNLDVPTSSMPELKHSSSFLSTASTVGTHLESPPGGTGGPSQRCINDESANKVTPKRQLEFERYFRDKLALSGDRVGPDDLLVTATQSADLQAKILIHGRLYLTASYLCFRANILGFRTEKVHRLRDVRGVYTSTTAKWIQNAIDIEMEPDAADAEGQRVFGYGSMADRDALFAATTRAWKGCAPEKYEAMGVRTREAEEAAKKQDVFKRSRQRERAKSSATAASGRPRADTGGSSLTETDGESAGTGTDGEGLAGSDGETLGAGQAADSRGSASGSGADTPKETECCGEHYKETALDTTLPIRPEKLFELLYRNNEFVSDLMGKLGNTDLKIGEWAEREDGPSRELNYVMHMNNKIGPSKSDCNGRETIVAEDPAKAFEILSETQTPDIPSGKSFVIRTRTCLTHTTLPNRSAPSTRMYCTTQCDWTASSWLKGTITPAVIKGQGEYHQKLIAAVKAWIKAHPADFEVASDDDGVDGADAGKAAALQDDNKSVVGETVARTGKAEDGGMRGGEAVKGWWAHAGDIPANPVMLAITALCVLSVGVNMFVHWGAWRGLWMSKELVLVETPAPPAL